jgi:hypothetical protein
MGYWIRHSRASNGAQGIRELEFGRGCPYCVPPLDIDALNRKELRQLFKTTQESLKVCELRDVDRQRLNSLLKEDDYRGYVKAAGKIPSFGCWTFTMADCFLGLDPSSHLAATIDKEFKEVTKIERFHGSTNFEDGILNCAITLIGADGALIRTETAFQIVPEEEEKMWKFLETCKVLQTSSYCTKHGDWFLQEEGIAWGVDEEIAKTLITPKIATKNKRKEVVC